MASDHRQPQRGSFSQFSSRAQRERGRERDRDRARDRDSDRDRGRDRDQQSFLPPRPRAHSRESHRPSSYYGRDGPHDARDRNYSRHDSWPSRNGSYNPPPPPRHPQPPPPSSDSPRPPQGDFTFRVDKPFGIDNSPYDSYRPTDGRASRSGRSRLGGRNARRGARGGRGNGYGALRFLAADRPILRGTHARGPEEAFYDADAAATYRPLDELSDSEEEEMDISSDESEAPAGSIEPSKKRARVALSRSASDSAAPKWSNPDPYTALPPPDTTGQQKKKDVVQLIRKARVQERESKRSIPAEAAEFISCDFDDSGEDDGEEVDDAGGGETAPASYPPGAPTGPRSLDPSRPPDPSWDFKKHSDIAVTQPLALDSARRQPTTQDASPAGAPDPAHHALAQPGRKPRKQTATDHASSLTAALGSRKRTHDDQIILPDHARLKRANKMPVHGVLVEEWEVKSGEDPCPWLDSHPSPSANMGVRLHKEIVDFYEHVRPQDFEERIRQELVQELKAFCRSNFRDAEVYSFGSFPSGLYLPTGDMDLVMCSDSYLKGGRSKYSNKSALFRLRAFVQRNRLAYMDEVELILHAKVPLVKYIDRRTGLKMDISFENVTGLQAIKTFLSWKQQYPAMPTLVTLIKHFLVMRGLNEPVNGGIGGFSVICLVVSMLQMMPEVQSRNMDTTHHLGDLLLEFLDLYGNRFNYRTTAISLNPPKYIPKNAVTAFAYKNQDRLSIIDPNNPANDIAGGSSNTATILANFSEAYKLMIKRMRTVAQSPGERVASILEVIFAGDYSTFRDQRAHLRKLAQYGLSSEDHATS